MNLNESQMSLSEEEIQWYLTASPNQLNKQQQVRNYINKEGVFRFSEWIDKNS